jgi:hypothetical protein
MGTNILASDVGAKSLIPVFLPVEYQTTLCTVPSLSEFPRAQEEAEFERHIETSKPRRFVQSGTRDVVNSISAIGDETIDLLDPCFATILHFEGTPGHEPAVVDCKNDRAKERTVSLVEGNV